MRDGDLNRAFGWSYKPVVHEPPDDELEAGVAPHHPSAYWTCRPEIASAACKELLRLRRSLGGTQ